MDRVIEYTLQQLFSDPGMGEGIAADIMELSHAEILPDDDGACPQVTECRTFDEAGVMTMNKGIVLRLSDGSEYQITIVHSRSARS